MTRYTVCVTGETTTGKRVDRAYGIIVADHGEPEQSAHYAALQRAWEENLHHCFVVSCEIEP